MPILWIFGIIASGFTGYTLLDKAGETAREVAKPVQETSTNFMALALVGVAVFLVYEIVIKKRG